MNAIALELFFAGFVAPVVIMFLILAVARRLRLVQERRSRRMTIVQRASDEALRSLHLD